MAMHTTAKRFAPRATFSASSRPLPPDFTVHAAIEASRLRRAADGLTKREPAVGWSRLLPSLLARLAGARRFAGVALTLLLTSGVGDDMQDQTLQGAPA
jgi:hypothetical protein